MKLVTRAQLGWPASAAPTQTTANGVKVHYEGTAVSTKLLTDHGLCISEWKAIRASHLANTQENYSDVAYNYAACPHGYLLEGRGLRKRTGANGNATLNAAHYAIVGLVGSSGLTKPTDDMLHAIRDGIELLRANGAGSEIKGHRDGYATACPGAELYAWVQQGSPRPTSQQEEDVALTADDIEKVKKAVVPEVVKAIFDADVINAVAPPDENADWHDGNVKWSFAYAVHSPNVVGRETRRLVKELDAKVDALTVGGVDLDALAEKVADKLHARLAD